MNDQARQTSDNEVRKVKKRRSRFGCTTCRRRKVRCDEQHPICSACVRLKAPCKWKGDPNDLGNASSLPVSKPNDSPGSQAVISDTSGSTTYETKSPSQNSDLRTSVGHTIEESKKTVTITAEDQEPLQHFVTTMSKFCVLRNCVYDDLYGYILTNMALFHQPLFSAMMAWSFLHLSHLRKQPVEEAQIRYEAATALLDQSLLNIQDADLVLTTIWFLLQYQLLLADGVDKFLLLLNIAADVTKSKLDNYERVSNTSPISPIGCIVLVWMSARESQAAHFGGTGRLLGYLKLHPYIYDLIDKSSVVEDLSSNLHESESTLMRDCMRLSLRNMIVNGQITLLGRWKSPAADPSSWASVRTSLAILRKEVEEDSSIAAIEALAVSKGSLTAMPKVSPLAYNRLLLLASYYGALISYHQSSPAIAPENSSDIFLDAEECAYRIIRITQRVTRDRPNSPQAFWPTILFKAATTVKDPVYQSWAVRTLELGEKWGANLIKTRVLLENMIDRQNWSGMDVDFVKVMEETTGYFIV